MDLHTFEPDELRIELNRLFAGQKHPGRRLVALAGRASYPSVDTDVGPVLVRTVESEYGLRRALPAIDDDGQRMAVLIATPQIEIPIDLSWRFVSNGKVFRVGKADRLRQLFGGPASLLVADASLTNSKLARLLLAAPPAAALRTNAGRITLEVAYETWLKAVWRLGADASLGVDTMLAWAATRGGHADFLAMSALPAASGVREELDAFLRARVGDVAPTIWRLWSEGKGRALLEFAVLFEALADDEANGPLSAVRTASKHVLGLAGQELEQTWRPLGRAVEAALRELERITDVAIVRQLLKNAQAHLDASDQAQLVASRRLPIAWQLRLDRLGTTLSNAADAPTPAAVAQAREDLLLLDRHTHSADPHEKVRLDQAEMATRLLAWLVARTDERIAKGRSPSADAEALAIWYAQEGGYLDRARHRCRGAGESAFGKGVARVLAKVDEIRVSLDRRFARSLAARLEGGDKSETMVPIHEAVRSFVTPFLEADPERRVLILLIDGMAWAQAVAMLESLDGGTNPWCPAAWNVEAFPKTGRPFTPVLASLPSVTNISRSAFFAGKAMEPGKKHSAGDNQKHWEANSAIKKFFEGLSTPKLMLRGEGFKTDGSAATEAITLVNDLSRRVVALVINAIDETLKTDTQAQGVWTADEIGPLRELLREAANAGRSVLIASDHGHVSGQRLEWTGFYSDQSTSRWRTWRENDQVHEYEVAIAHHHTWGPKGHGVKGIICLADDAHSYSNQSHYGEHGGATLSEVLAPTFMIACESLQSPTHPDRSLELRRLRPPDWWHLDLHVVEAPKKPAVAKKPTGETRKNHDKEEAGQQLLIPDAVPPQAATSLSSSMPSDVFVSASTRQLLDKLVKNPVFAARAENPKRRDEVIRALEFLLDRSGHAPIALFTASLGQPAFRVGGLVANLSEILNVDGYEVLTVDLVGKQVVLNAAQLRVGFGL